MRIQSQNKRIQGLTLKNNQLKDVLNVTEVKDDFYEE